MSNAQVKSVAHLQIDSSDRFMLYTLIGSQIHSAGDLDLNNIAAAFCRQAQALGLSKAGLLQQMSICIDEVYGASDPGKVIPLK